MTADQPEPVPDPAAAAPRGTRVRAGNTMGRTRSAVASGAAMAIREYGARKTTMIHIAAAAGIAKGTLYNHVRTRSDAYRLLAEIEVGRLVDLLRPDEDVADVLQRASEFVATHPVIRSLAEQEPGALALVCLPGPLTEAGRTAVERSVEELVGPDAAPLVLRWLVSLMLDPADQAVRADQAATLAAIAESNRPPAT